MSPCVGVDVGVGVTLKSFTIRFFYMIGKVLSGELFCAQTGLILKRNIFEREVIANRVYIVLLYVSTILMHFWILKSVC